MLHRKDIVKGIKNSKWTWESAECPPQENTVCPVTITNWTVWS